MLLILSIFPQLVYDNFNNSIRTPDTIIEIIINKDSGALMNPLHVRIFGSLNQIKPSDLGPNTLKSIQNTLQLL